MAFQVGTRVDPRLGALDFSGFTNAANIQAASLAQLGEAIGGAIEKHQEKKIKKAEEEVTIKAIKSLSDQFGQNLDDDTIKAIAKDKNVRDVYKMMLDTQDSTTPQMSSAALRSLGQMFADEGFEYDEETGTMVRREGPTVAGKIGNFLLPGQPFGVETTTEFPEELIPRIKGAEEFIENKRIMQGQPMIPDASDVSGDPSLSSDTVLMVDRQGRPRRVLQKDVEAALQNGYKF